MNAATVARVELPVRGMTCAGCAARIERALRRGDGVVQAGVNFATGIASVEFDGARTDARQLCAIVAAAGYAAEPPPVDGRATADAAGFVAADELRLLGHDLAVTAALAVPVLALAMAHGVAALHAPWARWTQAALTAGVLATGGRRFFRAAWAQARHGTAAMDALVALGTAAAFLFSLLVTAWPGALGTDAAHAPIYFESAAAIVLFVLLGRWLEARARRRAGQAIGRLLDLQPRHARVERGGADVDVPVAELRAGDVVRLRPGETVPVDGEVLDGSSAVDESMLTGESVPVDKRAGEPVFAGTRNTTGALRLRALRPPSVSTLQQIVRLVQQAQGRRAPVAALADRVAGRFTPAVLVAAAVTFGAWFWLGSGSDALPHAVVAAVAVLIIACPCAMGLATPVAILVGTGRSAERGVLWKGGDALELAARVDTVLLDKTGTLTSGRMSLAEVLPLPNFTAEALLALAAATEHGSEHPLAAAVVAGARAAGVAFAVATEFRALVGAGVSARVVGPDGGHRVLVGKAELLAEHGVDVAPLQGALAAVAAAAHTPLLVAVDDRPAGVLALADAPRPEATAAVAALHGLSLQVVLVTGDRREVADAVGRALLIEHVHAGMSPADKAALVLSLRQQGRRVAMVGDGINDAPALAAADVGIAIGSGTDVAIEAAGATLLRADLLAVPEAFVLARATLRTIRQNLGWAFGYNAAAVPLAAGALFPFTGWQLSPMLASAAMAASSVSVVLNSLRLRRAGLPRSEQTEH